MTVANRFKFYPANTQERKDQHEQVRDTCLLVATILEQIVPESRERELALTHLEETMFWANAAIARQDA